LDKVVVDEESGKHLQRMDSKGDNGNNTQRINLERKAKKRRLEA